MKIKRQTCRIPGLSAGRLMVPLMLLGLAVPMAIADIRMVTREGSGQTEGGTSTVLLWSGSDRIARIDGNSRMIGDLSAEILYLVNDETRTCHAMPTRNPDQDPAALQAAVESVKFRKTGASARIGQWQTEVYELVAGENDNAYEMAVWIAPELAVDPIQRAYMESVATPETAAMLAVYDLGGFPVRSEVRMGSIQTWSELESIEKKPAPAGTYEVPEGYSGCE